MVVDAVSAWCERRMFLRDFDVFFLGTAMAHSLSIRWGAYSIAFGGSLHNDNSLFVQGKYDLFANLAMPLIVCFCYLMKFCILTENGSETAPFRRLVCQGYFLSFFPSFRLSRT